MRATPIYLSCVIIGSSKTLVALLTVGYGIICNSFVSVPTQHSPCWKLTKLPASSGGRSSDQAALRSKTDQEREIFDWLAENAGVKKSVSLGVTSGGLRGLVADCDIQQGQIMLEVPSRVCLWSNRDGVVSGLYGQTDQCWEAAGDLRNPVSDDDFARGMTWDVRLALGLMEATSDPQIGGKLWPIYGRLLPQPHTVTIPFCLPERLLTQLHNEGMAGRARKQVERLCSLYPGLMQQTLLAHPRTAVYAGVNTGSPGSKGEGGAVVEAESDVAPVALSWAFAMVRSRAFAGGDDRFAFVPFLDMANHGFAPSSNFTFEDPGVFRLRAMRDVREGEEVTISYSENLDAEQLMVQYGLPLNPTVSLSRPLADPVSRRNSASSPLEEEARRNLMDEMFMCGQQRFAREAGGDNQRFEGLVRRAIPIIPNIVTMMEESCCDAGAQGARVCLQDLQAYRSANFPTSEQQDQELLKFCESEGKGKVDQRLAEVVRYRIDRKEAHSMAVGILEEFLSAQEA